MEVNDNIVLEVKPTKVGKIVIKPVEKKLTNPHSVTNSIDDSSV